MKLKTTEKLLVCIMEFAVCFCGVAVLPVPEFLFSSSAEIYHLPKQFACYLLVF